MFSDMFQKLLLSVAYTSSVIMKQIKLVIKTLVYKFTRKLIKLWNISNAIKKTN